jgi:hypothetical protein
LKIQPGIPTSQDVQVVKKQREELKQVRQLKEKLERFEQTELDYMSSDDDEMKVIKMDDFKMSHSPELFEPFDNNIG